MTDKQNEVLELIDLETGECLFRGTMDQCLGHYRANGNVSAFTPDSADEYRKALKRKACNG